MKNPPPPQSPNEAAAGNPAVEPRGAGADIPLYFKTPSQAVPTEDCAYLVTLDGLFLHRRNRFFESCVPVPAGGGPASLAGQKPFLVPRFPRIPRRLFRQVMAFCRAFHRREGAEVIVFFTVAEDGTVGLLVPPQTAVVQLWRGDPPLPVRLSYELPDPPPGTVIFGDIHSHGCEDAYSSWMDVADEQALTGLHLVVGRLDRALPEFHVEATIDGFRFSMPSLESVLEPASPGGADASVVAEAVFPAEWSRRVEIRRLPPRGTGYGYGYGNGSGYGAGDRVSVDEVLEREGDRHG